MKKGTGEQDGERTGISGYAVSNQWRWVDHDTSVRERNTHNPIPQLQSNHPLEYKTGVVKTFAYRARTVVSEREDRREELEHWRGALKCNGYPDWILRLKDVNNNQKVKVNRSEEVQVTPDKGRAKKIPVVIPNIKGFSEQLRWVLGRYGTPTSFKPTNTLPQLLVKPKDPVSKENMEGPVYKIKCEECEAMYVGEMERSL